MHSFSALSASGWLLALFAECGSHKRRRGAQILRRKRELLRRRLGAEILKASAGGSFVSKNI